MAGVTSAIASLPAGTAASRSSTTSSGDSSSSAFVGFVGREQEDLGVDAVERPLDLLLVPHLDGAVEPELERPPVQALEPAVVLVERVEDEHHRVGRRRGVLERDVGTPEDRQRGRPAHRGGIPADDERLGALLLGRSGGLGVLDRRDDGDPVALGDRVAEAALRHHLRP